MLLLRGNNLVLAYNQGLVQLGWVKYWEGIFEDFAIVYKMLE